MIFSYNFLHFIFSFDASHCKCIATLTAKAAGRKSCTKYSSIDAKSISGDLQIDLVSRWLRAAVRRRFETNHDRKLIVFEHSSTSIWPFFSNSFLFVSFLPFPSALNLNQQQQTSPDDNEDQNDVHFRHITEITILTVQLIVEFAKGLPAFTKIPQEDQITLLKVGGSADNSFSSSDCILSDGGQISNRNLLILC